MKAGIFIAGWILMVLTTGLLPAQEPPLFPVKSGMIKYRFDGRIKGTEIIYFDDYGKQLYDSKLIDGHKNGNITIYSDESVIVLSENDHRARIKDGGIPSPLPKLISRETLQVMGYKKAGEDKIAGIRCEKYTGDDGTLWIWDNVILKSEMEVMGIPVSSKATEVMTGITIPASRFRIPPGYKTEKNNPRKP